MFALIKELVPLVIQAYVAYKKYLASLSPEERKALEKAAKEIYDSFQGMGSGVGE